MRWAVKVCISIDANDWANFLTANETLLPLCLTESLLGQQTGNGFKHTAADRNASTANICPYQPSRVIKSIVDIMQITASKIMSLSPALIIAVSW
jgi:hypothetical protein